ncbi:hypothetical protein V2J09_024165 [Rumex salicifolius]
MSPSKQKDEDMNALLPTPSNARIIGSLVESYWAGPKWPSYRPISLPSNFSSLPLSIISHVSKLLEAASWITMANTWLPHPPISSPRKAPATTNVTVTTATKPFSPGLLFRVLPSSSTSRWSSSFVVFSNKPKDAMTSEKKRELFERYGLDPDDFLSEPSPKRKRKKDVDGKTDRRKEAVVVEQPRPPRTTHRLLQVLAGTAKRKKLLSPSGMDVRPMMEVVKGAAFDILQVAGGCPASLRPGRWLDLYSGTGSVGIEALSRGCSQVHFVEMDPWVVSDVLQPNLEWTGFLEDSVIHTVRVEVFLQRAQQFLGILYVPAGKDGTFDYISVTPPYMLVDYGVLMDQISSSCIVGENTFIVVEYPLGTDMLDSCGCLTKIADRRFGRTHLAIYGPKWAEKKRKPKTHIQRAAQITSSE